MIRKLVAAPVCAAWLASGPEDVDDELQGDVLNLPVEPLLPVVPLGPELVHRAVDALPADLQVIVQLKASPPAQHNTFTFTLTLTLCVCLHMLSNAL